MSLVRPALLVAALVAAPSSSAATSTPCWQRVLADWTNGSVQSSYAAACYAKALKRLPTDVRLYSDADQEIRRAMLAAIRKENEPPTTGGAAAAGRSAAGRVAEAKARSLPLPVLFAITLALTLVAVGVVGRVRARRSAQRRSRALQE
jgi:hypothetical protein